MLHRKNQAGFTITELLVVIVVGGFLLAGLVGFFNGNINQYFKLQSDGMAYSEITNNSQRIARVLRGIKSFDIADANTITAYTYFAPQEDFTSQIKYYISNDGKQLLADVTPMTADFPIGTLDTSKKRTGIVIIDSFYQQPGVPLFAYTDSAGNSLTTPVSNLNSIKSVVINLSVKPYQGASNKVISTQLSVSLRNRKTNL
jgi:prepilin-type N-terminal cleavage/methylation domain-containing protein